MSGRKILILGNGPSLKKDYFSAFENVATLGMNAAYRFWRQIDWRPTIYCCLDDQVVLSHADEIMALIAEGRCQYFFLHHNILQRFPDLRHESRVVFLPQVLFGPHHGKTCKELGINHAPNEYFKTSQGSKVTTGAYALRFAASLGYSDIGVVGVDCRYKEMIDEAEVVDGIVLRIKKTPKENPNYFFEDYQAEGDIYNVPNPSVHNGNLHLQSFQALAEDYTQQKRDVHISVCAFETELYAQNVFPYKNLHEFTDSPQLSAVFTPFIARDVDLIEKRFATWAAAQFAPYRDAPRTPRVELHLAYNKVADDTIEERLTNAFEKHRLGDFFSKLVFDYSELTGLRDLYTPKTGGPVGPDGYIAGPNNQFLDIIQRFSRGMSHVLLLEADVAPLKTGWLQRIEELVTHTDGFWFCGSHYRGVGDIDALWHINGNAIYRVGSEEFKKFFVQVYLPHLRARVKKQPRTPYDIVLHDLFRGLFSDSTSDDTTKIWQEIAHRVRFSDFIVNISHEDDRLPERLLTLDDARTQYPDAFLFHGATSKIDSEIDELLARPMSEKPSNDALEQMRRALTATSSDSSAKSQRIHSAPIEIDAAGIPRYAHATVNETEAVAQLLHERRGTAYVMLDVGAHFGTSAHYFNRLGWTIHCFEPDSANRKKLVSRWGKNSNISIDPRAVSDKPATDVPFFSSEESTGISGLSAFHETHKESDRVDITTVANIVLERKLDHIDFLKIDVEGFDFSVLKGIPWDRLKPDVIECEFEDTKTLPMGHTWKDIADYLVAKGYKVYISEWHPIIRYGIPHDWRQVAPYPGATIDPNAWGNILAFQQDPGYETVSGVFEIFMNFRPASHTAERKKTAITGPAASMKREVKLPSDVDFGNQASKQSSLAKGGDPPTLITSSDSFYARVAKHVRSRSGLAFRALQFPLYCLRLLKRRPVFLCGTILAGIVAPLYFGSGMDDGLWRRVFFALAVGGTFVIANLLVFGFARSVYIRELGGGSDGAD